MSVGSWVVFVCFPAILAQAFFVPRVVPVSGGILGLKNVAIDGVAEESAVFGFIMVAAAATGS